MNANQVVDILSLGDRLFEGNRSISARSIAHSILVTQRRFCQSGADTLQLAHVPDHRALAGVSEAGRQEFNEEVIHKATLLWERRVNRADEVPLGHDGYLKVWALTRPRFLVDFILLDEAQDTNEVVLNILRDQEAQIVLVGDRHQQIYEWRGAVNAMESVITRHDASLRQSFRFGSTIARAATKVLNKLGETLAIIGNPKVESHFIAHEKATVLSRTNASAFVACVEAIEKNLRPHMVGGVEETKALLRGVVDLKEGRPTPVPEFFGFENWQQVLECVNAGEADDLATFVNLVQLKGERALLWALNRTSALEEGSDLIVSTAHRSKGREWDHVRLSDDFLKTEPGQIDKPLAQIPPEELRLLYVAMTRAKMTLDLPVSIQQFIS